MKWFWRYVWNRMKQIDNEPEDAPSVLSSSKTLRVTAREHDWHENLNIMEIGRAHV